MEHEVSLQHVSDFSLPIDSPVPFTKPPSLRCSPHAVEDISPDKYSVSTVKKTTVSPVKTVYHVEDYGHYSFVDSDEENMDGPHDYVRENEWKDCLDVLCFVRSMRRPKNSE